MTAKTGITLRLTQHEYDQLETLKDLFYVNTYSAAIKLAVQNYQDLREKLHDEEKRRRLAEEELADLKGTIGIWKDAQDKMAEIVKT